MSKTFSPGIGFSRKWPGYACLLVLLMLSGCKSDKTPPGTSTASGTKSSTGTFTTTAVTTTASGTPEGEKTNAEILAAVKPGDPIPLNRQQTVLYDLKNKRVLLKTKVVLREGPLELLCCKKKSKEHESILAVDSEAFLVQTALITIGAKPGGPAKFQPKYAPPFGEKIDIFVNWTDSDGKERREKAQNWIRSLTPRFYVAEFQRLPKDLKLPEPSELRYDSVTHELSWYGTMKKEQRDILIDLSKDEAYQKAIQKFYDDSQPREMTAEWVFVGSGFIDQPGGKKAFMAEDGDVICVANFINAVIDVNTQSSESASNLMYEAYTERIPPRDTPVTIELIPRFAEAAPKK